MQTCLDNFAAFAYRIGSNHGIMKLLRPSLGAFRFRCPVVAIPDALDTDAAPRPCG